MLYHLHSYFLYVNTAETGGMWAREFFIDTTRSTTRITLSMSPPNLVPQASWWEPWKLLTRVGRGGVGWRIMDFLFMYRRKLPLLSSQNKRRKGGKNFCCFEMRMKGCWDLTLTIWIVNKVSPGVREPRVFHLERSLASYIFTDIFLGANLGAYL